MKTIRACSFLAVTLLLASPHAAGHNNAGLTLGTAMDAALVANYRNDEPVEAGEAWSIPGAMLGGEAIPAEQGASVDELMFTLSHVDENGVYALVKLASHHGSEAELEHGWVGYQLVSSEGAALQLEVGRMAGKFSPGNQVHADTRLMSDAPLALDVFFGRQYNDEGVRLLWNDQRGLLLGIEAWQGDAFPASPGEDGGAVDLFLQYGQTNSRFSWTLGGWYMDAKADARSDTRYESGHSHGAAVVQDLSYTFTGDSTLYGVNLNLTWALSEHMDFSIGSEWFWQDVEGEIRDETRLAQLDGEINGGWVEPALTYRQHTIGLRYERMTLVNDFTGAAGEALAQEANLDNQGFNPERLSIAYRYQLQPALALRAEWVSDESTPQSDDRFSLGIIWQKTLWSDRQSH